MRLAVSRAVAIETPRGWRITKEKQSHKIDVVVALGMAAWAAVSMGANADRRGVVHYCAIGRDGTLFDGARHTPTNIGRPIPHPQTHQDWRM